MKKKLKIKHNIDSTCLFVPRCISHVVDSKIVQIFIKLDIKTNGGYYFVAPIHEDQCFWMRFNRSLFTKR